ncbi:hypothetical protein [Corynebacterium urogenitale]
MKIRKFLTATLAASALTVGVAAPAQAQTEGSLPTPEQAIHFSQSIPVWITGFAAMPFVLGSAELSSALGICIFPDAPYLCD